MPQPARLVLLLPLLAASITAAAQGDPSGARACAAIEADAARLACYDRAYPRPVLRSEQAEPDTPPARTAALAPALFRHEPPAAARPASLLDSRWELHPDSKLGDFHLRAHRPVYVLPFFNTSDVNAAPDTPAPGHRVETPERLRQSEAKFQLSFKTKVWEGVFGHQGDLWLGYTQDSHWQVDNPQISRPFRETNYEPEALLVFGTDWQALGWRAPLLAIGANHQSNGRSLPLSRSWNRVIAQVGLERGPWTVMLRPWWRVHESFAKDDNPDILDYLGHGDVQLVREWRGHEFALLWRPSPRGGAVQIDWAFPLLEELRGHVQVFDGYGESLIDYNHRATYVGLGLSLLEWY